VNIVDIQSHNDLVQAAYLARGFNANEALDAAEMGRLRAENTFVPHMAIKLGN
jgi:hypothetical protein